MNYILLLLMVSLLTPNLFAKDQSPKSMKMIKNKDGNLMVDYRPRPPEMMKNKTGKYIGPLVAIVDELEEKSKLSLNRITTRQFRLSLSLLEKGTPIILPRTFCTKERAKKIDYLGPIGYQKKEILFLVKKGKKNIIKSYNDLHKFKIGAKARTAYFEKFDKDTKIKKVISFDDLNMVRMLVANRFDAMIVIDKESVEVALKKNKIHDYEYAEYKDVKKIWNYFAIPKNLPQKAQLQKTLEKMVKDGRINHHYKNSKIPAPEFDGTFKPCP